MEIKTFDRLTTAYKDSIGTANLSHSCNPTHISSQSQFIWFDHQIILKMIEPTVIRSGGLKMYFAAYDKGLTKDPGLIGLLSIIVASNDHEYPTKNSPIENGGPYCS